MEHFIQKEVFAELYLRYYTEMVKFAYTIIEDSTNAEDIVSNAFARLPPKMTEEQRSCVQIAKPFFYVCIRNACIDHCRQRRKYVLCNIEPFDFIEEPESDIRMNRLIKIKEILDNLSNKSSHILREIYVNNKDTTKIANELGITRQTVLNLKSRAIDRIRKVMEGTYSIKSNRMVSNAPRKKDSIKTEHKKKIEFFRSKGIETRGRKPKSFTKEAIIRRKQYIVNKPEKKLFNFR